MATSVTHTQLCPKCVQLHPHACTHRGGEGQHLGPIPKQHINVGPAAAVMAGPPLVHKGMPLALGRNLVVHMERIMVEVQPIQSLWTGTRTQQRGKINVVLGVMAVVAVPAAAAVGGAPLLLPIAHLQLQAGEQGAQACCVDLMRMHPWRNQSLRRQDECALSISEARTLCALHTCGYRQESACPAAPQDQVR
eukprot:1159078-Pelagomonas_calceolata.AAC.5